MSSYVDRRALFDALFEESAITARGIQIFRDFPSARVRETTLGEWLELDSCMSICSECKGLGCGSRYCPNCGAEMEIEE